MNVVIVAFLGLQSWYCIQKFIKKRHLRVSGIQHYTVARKCTRGLCSLASCSQPLPPFRRPSCHDQKVPDEIGPLHRFCPSNPGGQFQFCSSKLVLSTQKQYYPDHFCNARTVIQGSFGHAKTVLFPNFNAIRFSDVKTHSRKIFHRTFVAKQDITLQQLFFHSTCTNQLPQIGNFSAVNYFVS